MKNVDIVIVGGGMAGASLGAEVARDVRTLILEMEQSAGYHSTGRSVAFWEETYGGPAVQPLTTASGPLLARPHPSFHHTGFLSPRRTLHVGRASDVGKRDTLQSQFAGKVELKQVDPKSFYPGLRDIWTLGVLEPSCQDIDVAALHQAYLRGFRKEGGEIWLDARFMSATRDGDGWLVQTTKGPIHCTIIANAAGAWADDVAQRCGICPIGIVPLRRTVVQLRISGIDVAGLPLLMDMNASFYFKPEGSDRIWLTPHDEEPSLPCDAAPEELAVAQAVARFEDAVDWPIAAVERKWAGLRSFASDRAPVYGFDLDQAGFFWFAGQGGFGIQTAPAAALLGRSKLLKETPAPAISNISPAMYDPSRFR